MPLALRRLTGLRLVPSFAGALAFALLACSSSSSSDNPGSGGDGGSTPSTSCESQYPASQTLSQPCCLGWGADACGADLFCAALDGRTQPTCYPQYSRLPGQTCTDPTQCTSAGCAPAGTCEQLPGQPCTAAQGCGSGPGVSTRYYCGDEGGQDLCLPCAPGSIDPACTAAPSSGDDAGAGGSGDGGLVPPTSSTIAALCSADAGAACQQCCSTDSAGAKLLFTAVESCVCSAGGAGARCAQACADEICAGKAASTGGACGACVSATTCESAAVSACSSDTTCDAFFTCETKNCLP